jgi:hypothetical protein
MCRGCGPEGEALARVMEFDHPITVHADGTVSDGPAGIYAPEALHDGPADVLLDGEPWRESSEWELLTGYTGQHGYRGAVLHASEYIGGGLARDILATPGVYVAVAVESEPTDDDFPRWEGHGYASLHRDVRLDAPQRDAVSSTHEGNAGHLARPEETEAP